ncbi:MAG: transketolase C-terminal domain-containing protein [Candidatus Bathyarchaeia archaeon]
MAKRIGLIGDDAVAHAAKQCDVDVVAAYPITPQTLMVETFSQFVANGEVDTEFVCVESEHSAISACVAASLSGARVFTATASQGIALMHEVLYAASGCRCPIVMGVANRALSAPINIHCDHSDVMGSRDSGWIQIFVENAQEAYDTTIQAFKLAEDPEILLPVMVNLDGFIISHSMEGVIMLEDEEVKAFLPPREIVYKLDPEKPITIGPVALPDYYYEFKYQQADAMSKVPEKLKRIDREYAQLTGRRYGLIQTYGMRDAETAIVCMGSTAGTARTVAKTLRREGKKVGLIKVRLYRPFPTGMIVKATRRLKALAVMDRAASLGAPGGPLYSDLKTALYGLDRKPLIFNVIYGLGGRDITPTEIAEIFDQTLTVAKKGKVTEPVTYMGVRE